MRPAMSLVNLLLLFLLFNDTAEGIRLEQHSLVSIHRISTQEAYLRGGARSSEEEVLCREGETCSGWNNRKMMMIKTREATASSPKSEGVKEIKGNSDQSPDKESTSPESYPDILDIAGMDYSPAKKKSPIHN
ncbi:uncharacterized protein LOC110111693 [Dendrobium catenatum]|uniref:Uncharacterized protein n=1 Tax=Dendrobium catenatum TaxID=906689 RepID=A0A2I0VT22_9ASPA|nr:uncharacterized protein LOC110111693 [Dendrobium catenatum]PKU66565.1 hypothetical protein MA16_Dca006893 [Dendrobium catenatum]